jgi:hypothetical protein
MATIREKPAVSFSKALVGVATAAMTTFALVACTSPPSGNSAADIDAQYGIPAGSVPSYMLKPDGLMTNGLLPAQPYDTGG